MDDRTRCVHQPLVSHDGYESMAVPTYRASTIVFDDARSYEQRASRAPDGYTYGLNGTPTTRTLEAQLTELEFGARTTLVPSGQAAITAVMLAILNPGDHVLIPDTVYPPVRKFCDTFLARHGVDTTYYDPLIGAGISESMTKSTQLVWVESPGSTTMEIQDVRAIADAAHAKNALVGCDNTWATPLLFKPLAHGADFSIEAITKYIGGHSDLLMGSISVRDVELHRKIKQTTREIGFGVSPDDCSLALRGLQTLSVRLAHVGPISTLFAERIEHLSACERVFHPALPSCPGHAFWTRDFSGASGVFSVALKPGADRGLEQALPALRLFRIGASWGGVGSLIAPMRIQSERTVIPLKRNDPILRLSIGLEDSDELWNDIQTLFASLEESM